MAKKGAQKRAQARQKQGQVATNRRGSSPPPQANGCGSGEVIGPGGQRTKRGLQNLGNTCYMNSILQCLNVSVPFSDALLRLSSAGLGGVSSSLCGTFRGIRGLEEVRGGGGYSPKPLLTQIVSRFPWFRGNQQQDAHELLRTLLGSIADESTMEERKAAKEGCPASQRAPGAPPQPSTLCEGCVWDNFRGHLCAAVVCWKCCRVSMNLDPFLDLSLELPTPSDRSSGPLGVRDSASLPILVKSLPRVDGAEQEGEEELVVLSKKEKQEKKRQQRAEAAAIAAAEAASRSPAPVNMATHAPAGAWAKTTAGAGASAAAAARTLIKSLVERALSVLDAKKIVERLIRRALGAPAVATLAEEVETATKYVEIELTRDGGNRFGFVWNQERLGHGLLELEEIGVDSVLDKWNLRCRACGDEEHAVCVGDSLKQVNEQKSIKAMQKAIKNDAELTLRFCRGVSARKPAPVEAAVDPAMEERRKDFCTVAATSSSALPQEVRDVFGVDGQASVLNGHLELTDCFHRFCATEAIEDDYKPTYQCSSCAEGTTAGPGNLGRSFASRRIWLWPSDLPPLLTLQLKRFRRRGERFEKSSSKVALPTTLDLSSYVFTKEQQEKLRPHLAPGSSVECVLPVQSPSEDAPEVGCRYELYAVCVHEGSTLQSGHYVAYVNAGPSLEREDWHGISDARVWNCTREAVLKVEGYVAFYRREGEAAAAEGEEEEAEPAATAETNGVEAEEEDVEEGAADVEE